MEERKPLIPGKRACQTVRAVHNQPVYFGAGSCHHEKGRAWSVADILRRECGHELGRSVR